ncbi:MAG TPA: hypothetical protein VFH68_03645 [Polyangia bacterium]|nr:hypothetical protein [Polyangia bacterium]
MMSRRRFGLACGVLSTLAQVACSQVLDIPSDPMLAATGPWRCLSQTPVATPVATSAQANVRVQACNFITDCTTSVTGLTARVCDKRDVGCNSPRVSGIADTNGELRFQVPTAGGGFDGYLLIDSQVASCTDPAAFGVVAGQVLCGLVAPMCDLGAPDARCYLKLLAPTMLFFNPPIVGDLESPIALQMFPTSGLPAVISAAGIQIDPTAGSLFIQSVDCDGQPATAVHYQVDHVGGSVSSLYLSNGIISKNATQTDSTGVGGFVGVPPGFVTVTGYNSDSVAIGEVGVQVAASMLTYTVLVPAR